MGAYVKIGNSRNAWENEICGAEMNLGGTRNCNTIGRYAGVSKVIENLGGFFICCIPEFGAYSTINIAPEADLTFEGSS